MGGRTRVTRFVVRRFGLVLEARVGVLPRVPRTRTLSVVFVNTLMYRKRIRVGRVPLGMKVVVVVVLMVFTIRVSVLLLILRVTINRKYRVPPIFALVFAFSLTLLVYFIFLMVTRLTLVFVGGQWWSRLLKSVKRKSWFTALRRLTRILFLLTVARVFILRIRLVIVGTLILVVLTVRPLISRSRRRMTFVRVRWRRRGVWIRLSLLCGSPTPIARRVRLF